MNKKFIFSLLLTLAIMPPCVAKEASFFGNAQEPQIFVNNRILAKINGKPITVVDLMKKMDLLFYKQFPQYTSSAQARYQFYQVNWNQVLREMIDKELVLADALESKLVISAGDVRQEMETLFGPNIIDNLDKIGLTFDEASKMILADITIRRMVYFRVQLKAINQVTPQKIRSHYDEIAPQHVKDNEWIYNVVNIRHRNPTKTGQTAKLAYQLLIDENVPLNHLLEKLNETGAIIPTVTVSEEFHTYEKELSDVFKKTLTNMTPGTYSEPLVQRKRHDNLTVYRIFYLKEMIPGGVVPFHELEGQIKDTLMEEAIEKETTAYLARLRRHFNVQEKALQELLATDFQPFILR